MRISQLCLLLTLVACGSATPSSDAAAPGTNQSHTLQLWLDGDWRGAWEAGDVGCRDGIPSSCQIASWASTSPDALRQFGDEIQSRHETGCEEGNQYDCSRFADWLWYTDNGSRDTERAAQLLRVACDSDVDIGCAIYAMFLYSEPDFHDPEAAWSVVSSAQLPGGEHSYLIRAVMLSNGIAVEADADAAEDIYHELCEAGFAWGCSGVAKLAFGTMLGSRDLPVAREYFVRACHLGDPYSCPIAADMLERGAGGEVRTGEADRCWRYADAFGGWWYFYAGRQFAEWMNGEMKDVPRARRFAERGCRLGSQEACDGLQRWR